MIHDRVFLAMNLIVLCRALSALAVSLCGLNRSLSGFVSFGCQSVSQWLFCVGLCQIRLSVLVIVLCRALSALSVYVSVVFCIGLCQLRLWSFCIGLCQLRLLVCVSIVLCRALSALAVSLCLSDRSVSGFVSFGCQVYVSMIIPCRALSASAVNLCLMHWTLAVNLS